MPDQTALRLGTTLTLSFWMKLGSIPSAATRLVGKGASDTAQNYGVWTAAGDQHLFFKFHNGTTLQSVSTTTTFSTGTWYHVAVTLGSGQVQFFVNGAAQTDVAATGTPVTSTDPLTFGYAGYNGTFGGSLDEVSLFNTVLTSSQVSELYATCGMGLVCRYNVGTDLIGQELLSADTANWTASYYGYDGLGSVRVLYGSTGSTTDTYTYDAFGTLNSSSGSTTNHYRFAGEQWDEDLKLYYNRARYLNPDTGRFTSRDTYEGSPQDPVSLHCYTYCGGDPLNRIDPGGHDMVEMTGVQSISNTIQTGLGHVQSITRAYLQAKRFIDALNTLEQLVVFFQSGNWQNPLLDTWNSMNPQSIASRYAGITPADFAASLGHIDNTERILSWSQSWAAGLLKTSRSGNAMSGFFVQMPLGLPGTNPQGKLVGTGVSINIGKSKLPIKIRFGGENSAGWTLSGFGFLTTGHGREKSNLMWRVDPGPLTQNHGGIGGPKPEPNELDVWQDKADSRFHYHVMKPPG